MRFDAVILAGGASVRMGSDKALLPVGGETLVERQVRLARAAGAANVHLSCRKEAAYRPAGAALLFDRQPNAGPLEGIATALEHCGEDRLLVLAVDLPGMTGEFLSWLLARGGAGIVPESEGGLEPLAAIYLRGAAALARRRVAERQLAVRAFAEAACAAGWCVAQPVPEALAPCLVNWNRPGDWPGPGGG